MAEHESPPTRSILSLTWRLSALVPVAGAAVTLGTLGAVHMAAAVLIGVLATFVAFAGLLSISDWQADVQSRQEWARLGLTPVHLSSAAELARESDLDPRYLAPSSDAALQQVFRVYRVAAQIASNVPLSAQPAAQPSPHPEWDQARAAAAPVEADTFKPASRPVAGAPSRVAFAIARAWKGKRRKIEIAPRLRLVANGDAWPLWTTSVGPAAQAAAEVVVLSAGQNDRTRSQPATSIDSSKAEQLAQPTCRGPPRSRARRSAAPPDPVVCDNFGPRLPIGRAELDVIETYLERELRELLGYVKRAGDSEKA